MIRKNLYRHLSNLPGWRTKHKIVVIESDDWGSIRMPSLGAYERLERAGLNLKGNDAHRYNLNDSLATFEDLENLFQILGSFRDRQDLNPVFTAVSVVANPDFEKIREADFNEYFYEPFTKTLERYPRCDRSFLLWKEGIEKKLFVPQMHGREHLNVSTWMKALKAGNRQTILAFNEGLWGFVPDPRDLPDTYFQPAFLLQEPSEIGKHIEIIETGLNLFKQLFGYSASYFVSPNGPINNSLNETLFNNGIKFRSTAKIQHETLGYGKTSIRLHYLGQKDKTGITYITRNCFFEPSLIGKDWVDSCLNDIKIAFSMHKPAIISSHRVNYIGALNIQNRDRGLTQLSCLLKLILKAWPDVQFLTTPELGNLIISKPV
jgi:hypothetical protein